MARTTTRIWRLPDSQALTGSLRCLLLLPYFLHDHRALYLYTALLSLALTLKINIRPHRHPRPYLYLLHHSILLTDAQVYPNLPCKLVRYILHYPRFLRLLPSLISKGYRRRRQYNLTSNPSTRDLLLDPPHNLRTMSIQRYSPTMFIQVNTWFFALWTDFFSLKYLPVNIHTYIHSACYTHDHNFIVLPRLIHYSTHNYNLNVIGYVGWISLLIGRSPFCDFGLGGYDASFRKF